jgi:hypothetical protein
MSFVTFDWDETLVCESCGENDLIHYNLVIKHRRLRVYDDPDCSHWCERCCHPEPRMISVAEYQCNKEEKEKEEEENL